MVHMTQGWCSTGLDDVGYLWYRASTCGMGPVDAWYLWYKFGTCGIRPVDVLYLWYRASRFLVHVVYGWYM